MYYISSIEEGTGLPKQTRTYTVSIDINRMMQLVHHDYIICEK